MLIHRLTDCTEFVAGDGTRLRELLHPAKHLISARYSIAHASLAQGQSSHLHQLSTSEVYYILSGVGRMQIDDETRSVFPGDLIYIAPQAKQRITSLGSDALEFLCIVDPAWRAEDEVILEAT
ncbi:cupin domain-containing protein [candidate division KSB1 bacterium]|nr:cupin domain-containing protein [candidate division KSB1 bacterium]